jgi:NadR type nicotinamide-nucleotide adenylyltransferase
VLADQLVIDAALQWSPTVQVLLLTSRGDPLDPLVRMGWLQAMAPAAGIVPVELAHEARDPRGEVAELHELLASSPLVRPDAVVGPGLRDRALAAALGLAYLPVDVSAWSVDPGDVLRRPLAHWKTLPGPVRAHYLKRVVVMGPESTGKTTLARDLATAFGTAWTSEYLRIYLDAKGGICTPEDLPLVVAGHRATEAAAARRAHRVLFCDTDPLMTAVYSRFYYGTLPAWLDEAAGARRADHYLLLDCDVPWVADAQRDAPHAREDILALCREELERRGLPFTVIRGGWDRRVTAARAVVASLLREA